MSLTVPAATITNFSPITFSIPPDTPESSCYSIQRDRNVITLALRKLQLPTVDLGGCCHSPSMTKLYIPYRISTRIFLGGCVEWSCVTKITDSELSVKGKSKSQAVAMLFVSRISLASSI